jgi:hypothetical protein
MKKKSTSKSAFFYLRAVAAFALVLGATILVVFSLTSLPGGTAQAQGVKPGGINTDLTTATSETNATTAVNARAQESRLIKSARSFDGDLRALPYIPPVKRERPELEEPPRTLKIYTPPGGSTSASPSNGPSRPITPPLPSAPAPAPLITFDGLDFATWGGGHPPDTNGDVGPTYYIQTVNTSIGIYNKSNGNRVAAFTFNTFMSQGNFGNVCDTNNNGDPVVLYDTFEDRWVISDIAFIVQGNGANASPGNFQCIAVSKTGDPVSGGWNFYSFRTDAGLGDYPKFGIWPDGLYLTVDIFSYGSTPTFVKPQLYVFNKAQMYAGAPTVQTALFDIPSSEFALLPSNARLQTGTPPTGSPNYVAVVWQFLNAFSVYKAHVDWNSISLSTFTGPFMATDTFWWSQLASANQTAPTPQNRNDELYARIMMQNQYTNIGGVESLWAGQTAGNTNPTSNITVTQSSVRYYQVKVTGGTVEANTTQSFTYAPADTIWRYMPSVAVDRAGNMAIGYTTSNATTNPALKYAGRLSTDAANSITLTEQTLFQGTGAQSGLCGGATCTRWGDYSAMSLDPDGCTFWYTNEYYAVNGLNNLTRIGSFKFSPCTVVGAGGTVSGTVTVNPGGAPISGATVALGSRTTTTNGSGNYSFTGLPAGTYPSESASAAGYNSASITSIVVTDGGTTTKNFALTAAPTSNCPIDTTQADFQTGVATNTDLTTSAGNVILSAPTVVDQQTTNFTTNGFGFSSTSFAGNTFTPPTTGKLTRLDIQIFCSACSGADPNIIVDVRTTSGGNIVMTAGGLLATVTIPGTGSASGGYLTASFSTPPTLTGGTQYGFVIKLASTRTGTQAYLVSDGDGLANGRRQICSSASCSNATGQSNDIVFISYMNYGFATSGNFVSSAKDANPATGSTSTWGTLSWTNVALPAGTGLTFQAAASNDPAGVFNFTTTVANGGSLSAFNGFRYLKYKANFTTSNTANTPTLNDVTVCFQNLSPAPVLQSVVSRLTHGGAGTFNLPLSTSNRVIEPRSNGSGSYTVVFNFDIPVNAGSASVTSGTGTAGSPTFSGSIMIVPLSGVTDQQTLTVTASGVHGTNTQNFGSSVQIGFLQGDVTQDTFVNAGDTIVVRNNAGVTLDSTNFQNDVNFDGQVDVGDTTIVRNNSGHFLP